MTESGLKAVPVREALGGSAIQRGVISQPDPRLFEVGVSAVGQETGKLPGRRLVLRCFTHIQAKSIEIRAIMLTSGKARPGTDRVVLIDLWVVLLQRADLKGAAIAGHGGSPIAEQVYTTACGH